LDDSKSAVNLLFIQVPDTESLLPSICAILTIHYICQSNR